MLARQPYRIEGDRAYGLAIADDKQGIAVIIHTIAMLQALGFKDYATLTVLNNGDEEVSSPGARAQLTKNGAENDATLSFEASRVASDKLSLATSGIGAVILHVTGKASHAGSSPERGVNALVELSHQILQTKDFSDPSTGLKMNWTNAKAGSGSHNVIPESAEAIADVRVNRVDDYDRIEREVRERITPHSRTQREGRDDVRAAPAAPRGHARVHRAGPPRAGDLPRAGKIAGGGRKGRRGWNGCSIRCAQDEERSRRAFRTAGFWRTQRRR